MKLKKSLFFSIFLLIFLSCRQYIKKREITNYQYHDVLVSDTTLKPTLHAVSDEDYLQYAVKVAYLNDAGDTIIPFGKYAYFGTDSLIHYANVMQHPSDSTWGRQVAIDRNQRILFDLLMFDYGPDLFSEGLTRVLRNGKMGYANKYGQIVIPCIYDYGGWFHNGKTEVSFNAREFMDNEEHKRVESDEWFLIDKQGRKVK